MATGLGLMLPHGKENDNHQHIWLLSSIA